MQMKEKMKNNKYWYIWLVVGLGIGVTIGKLTNWGYFELSKEVSVIDALNIFITIGLTLYIASILEKRLKIEQFKSELYVAKICDIERHLIELEELTQDKNVPYQKINSHVHTIGIAKNSLFKSLPKLFCSKKEFDSIKEDLKTKHKELKSLLTDRPIDKQNNSVMVKNNLITYSADRISEIITVSYSIKDLYFKLKVLINE